jgi:putative DNA methylase
VALATFSDLVAEAREQVLTDTRAANLVPDPKPLSVGGNGVTAYADAVATYLA